MTPNEHRLTQHDLDTVDPEIIQTRRDTLRQRVANKTALIPDYFELFRILIYERDVYQVTKLEETAQLLAELRSKLDDALDAQPEDDNLRLDLIEWNNIALQYKIHKPNEFPEYPFFAEILALCEGRSDIFDVKRMQALLGLLFNYSNWLEDGGQVRSLPDTIRQEIEAYQSNIADVVESHVSRHVEQGSVRYAIPILRTYARFQLNQNLPNEAVASYKRLRDLLPQHPEFIPTDVADINLELGQLFLRFNKFEAAKPYFQAAFETYQAAGEPYQMLMYQAESLLEACEIKS